MEPAPFAALLELDGAGDDVFVTRVPPTANTDPSARLFGGQVAAQSLTAAAATVDADHHPHSVHCAFLSAGRPDAPIELRVERTRDGRSFSRRTVEAFQGTNEIFSMEASFHATEAGPDMAIAAPLDVELPDSLTAQDWNLPGRRPPWGDEFELRLVPRPPRAASMESAVRFWARARHAIAPGPTTLACMLLYVSDMHSGSAGVIANGYRITDARGGITSLDHAMWFHRSMEPGEWFFLDVRSVSTSGARGLLLGSIHSQSGVHVATYAQETLFRL